jgi:hypothetical protein
MRREQGVNSVLQKAVYFKSFFKIYIKMSMLEPVSRLFSAIPIHKNRIE